MAHRRRILVVTADRLGHSQAGPAIRAAAIADALHPHHDVTLASLQPGDGLERPYPVHVATDGEPLDRLAHSAEIVVGQGWVFGGRPALTAPDKVVVADIYGPIHLEQLEQGFEAGTDDGRRRAINGAVTVLNDQLRRADFFLCASDRQRDFWLGQLAALGRINARTYDADPTLRSLIDVAPFGLSAEPPAHHKPTVRGVVPGIGAEDLLLLWGGGVYNWFDPLTLLHAVHRLRDSHPHVRLYFMGIQHPNREIATMRMAYDTMALSDELGLTGTHAFFNEGWVEYDDRQNYLLDADIGVSTHLDHVETAFSFRTRILDYLWAGLPIVTTQGDVLADLVAAEDLGATVPSEDVDALVAALGHLADAAPRRAACAKRSAAVAQRYTWDRTLAPLLTFCANAAPAPDRADPAVAAEVAALQSDRPKRPGWRGSVQRAADLLAEGGAGPVARRLWTRARGRPR
jgi:glycosyltransferase involved in cell wall biosynthesis